MCGWNLRYEGHCSGQKKKQFSWMCSKLWQDENNLNCNKQIDCTPTHVETAMYQAYYDRESDQKTCLQSYISLTSYINLLISLAAIGVAIYRAVKNGSVWDGSSYDWNSLMIGLLVAGSALLLISAISGIVGSRKRNRCCLFFFNIFSMILAIVFLAVGFVFIGITVVSNDSINNSNCINQDVTILNYGQQAYDSAQVLLCSLQCPCNVTNPLVIPGLVQQMGNYISTNGVTRVQDCSAYSTNFSDSNISDAATWLEFLENSFQCTGMCSKPNNANVYFFSNINNGVPSTETCKQKFQSFLSTYGELAYLVSLIIGGYLLFNAIISLCLCCKKKDSGLSYRERLSPY